LLFFSQILNSGSRFQAVFSAFSLIFFEANERIHAILAGHLNFTTKKYLLKERKSRVTFFYVYLQFTTV